MHISSQAVDKEFIQLTKIISFVTHQHPHMQKNLELI